MVETLLDSMIATQIVLAFQANESSLQTRLPAPWRVAPFPAGPSQGANLVVLFQEALLNQEANGEPAADAVNRYVGFVMPATNPDTGESASLNFRILTVHPDSLPGKYQTARPATIRREQIVQGTDLETSVTDRYEVQVHDWDVGNPGAEPAGGRVDLWLAYRRGVPSRVSSQRNVRSAAQPSILRIYHQDQLADLVKSVPAGIDRVESFHFKVTVPELVDLFDGTEQLVSITISPWYVRRVFGRAQVQLTERMLREWQQALERYRKRRGRKVPWEELEPVIQAQLAHLQSADSAAELRRRYTAGNFWALQISRRLAPDRPDLWDLHYTADVAYALRFLEITGQTDAQALEE